MPTTRLRRFATKWGASNSVEVKIDYITSQGDKDKLTAAAEAQAGTGHDIMSHRDWMGSHSCRGARAARRCCRGTYQAERPDQSGL